MRKICPIMSSGFQFSTCAGSRCALWDSAPAPTIRGNPPAATAHGRCGLGKGDNFDDPAQTPKGE